ncbi:hypothetical protein ES702_02984 [subsurface metagenome]
MNCKFCGKDIIVRVDSVKAYNRHVGIIIFCSIECKKKYQKLQKKLYLEHLEAKKNE